MTEIFLERLCICVSGKGSLFQALDTWGRVKESGRKKRGRTRPCQTSSLALVLPHFFSCPCFRPSPTTESLEQHSKGSSRDPILMKEWVSL